MPADPKAWGRRLAQARKAAGFDSQRAFADAINMSHTTVGNWERGVNLPPPKTVQALADRLDEPELVELAGLTSDEMVRSTERIAVLEEQIAKFLENQDQTNLFLKRLVDEVAELRRQTGQS